jgi:hypothetical protein
MSEESHLWIWQVWMQSVLTHIAAYWDIAFGSITL